MGKRASDYFANFPVHDHDIRAIGVAAIAIMFVFRRSKLEGEMKPGSRYVLLGDAVKRTGVK